MTSAIRPGRGDITTTRSASSTASGIEWVTKTTAISRPCQMRSSSSDISSRVSASSAPKGSSISSTRGSCSSARQMATRCCMPPESSRGSRCSKPASPAVASSARARASVSPPARPISRSGKVTLRSTSAQGSSVAAWNTIAVSARGSVTARPSSTTCPALGRASPATSRSSVDLPQPEAPTMATNSPAATWSETSRSASTPPKLLLTRSRRITAAGWCRWPGSGPRRGRAAGSPPPPARSSPAAPAGSGRAPSPAHGR